MKRFLLSAVLTLAAASAAFANTPASTSAISPYNFVANGMELPAGRYNLEIRLTMVRLTSADGRTAVKLPASALRHAKARSTAEIVMQRQGGRMVLVGVRDANSGLVRVVGPNY